MNVVTSALCMTFFTMSLPINAQNKIEASAGADLVSGYIWRGQDCGNISVQPTGTLSYKGFSINAWGSVGFSKDDTKEFDWTLSYAYKGLSAGITDYWFNSYPKYFSYGSGCKKTSHVYEANLGYNWGVVSLTYFINFAGNDGINNNGKRAYSSYVEMGIPFKLGGMDFKAELGVVPYVTSYYAKANGFAVTNIGIKMQKSINVTPTFSIPLYVKVIANPSTQKAFFVAGITL